MPAFFHRHSGRFSLAAGLLLVVAFVIVAATAARDDSATFDEPVYIAAGYSYWATGDFRMNLEHPPLAKLLSAAPLRWLRPEVPVEHPPWAKGYLYEFAQQFLYRNRVPADTLIFWARAPNIALAALSGVVIALFTRRHFGASAALVALLLDTTDPNFLAHGRYAGNDAPVAAFIFFAVAAWSRYLTGKRWWDLVLSGAVLSLALLAKFSAVALVPVFVLLYLIRAWQEEGTAGPRLSVDRFFAACIVTGMLFAGLTAVAYGFQTRACAPGTGFLQACSLTEAVRLSPVIGHFLLHAARAFHLPDHPYLVGLYVQAAHQEVGHTTYLLGQTSPAGWWYYMPVAFAVKTPTVLLLTTVAMIAAAAAWLIRRGSIERLRRVPFGWIAAAVPAAVFGGLFMTSRVAIGIRYLLPVYPFLYVLAGAFVAKVVLPRARRFGAVLVVAIVAIQTAESAAVYPNHLAFFNTLAGGPERGESYLLDSNLDWGQDLKRLKRYMDRTGTRSVCLHYFGSGLPAYYGIATEYLPATQEIPERSRVNCIAAISATILHGLYLPPGYDFNWLRGQKPIARVGRSIWIYDLRRK